jgi:hypothetical protein
MVRLPLSLVLLLAAAPASAEGVRPPVRYVTTVSFGDGQCRYWTGDTMVDAAAFRRDLRRRFDRRSGMTIAYAADLPVQCVTEARKLVTQAGFRDIRLEAGRIGPNLP